MPKRNLIWILAIILILLLFWQWPDAIHQEREFYNAFSVLEEVRNQVHKNYVEDVDDQKLRELSIQGMLKGLDPFSRYISPEDMSGFDQMTSGDLQGIGIIPEERNGYLTVVSPIEDSPAFKAGIMPGDVILKIDGTATINLPMDQCIKKMIGTPGSKVTLQIRHENSGKIEDVEIIRDNVHIYSVKGFVRDADGQWNYLIDPKNKIGYIRISNFQTHTADELDQAWRELVGAGVQGLILDLRFNPGGLMEVAVEVCNRFLTKGVVVSAKDRWQHETTWNASSEKTYKPVPLVIIVNQESASAAEIVSGALKDHKRAKIIGVRTYGKGSVQSLIPLDKSYGAIKITTAHYYLPSGRNIHRRPGSLIWGVDPDILVSLSVNELEQLRETRKTADIYWKKTVTTRRGTITTRNFEPHPVSIDRQLEAGLNYLRRNLHGPKTMPSTRNLRGVVGE